MTDAPKPARPEGNHRWPFPPKLLEYPVAPPIPGRAPTPKPKPADMPSAPY